MNVRNLFRTLAVLPALALTFFSCDTGGGDENDKGNDGIDWITYPNGALTVVNDTSVDMVLFQGRPLYRPFAENTKEFLVGKDKTLIFYNYDVKYLTSYWKYRWYNQRKENPEIIEKASKFRKNDFII